MSPCLDACQTVSCHLLCACRTPSASARTQVFGVRLQIVALWSVVLTGRVFFVTLSDTFFLSALLMSQWSWQERYWKETLGHGNGRRKREGRKTTMFFFFPKTDPRRKEPMAQAPTEPEEDEENILQGPPACRILLLKK